MSEWKAVVGYEQVYEVSGDGAVRRVSTGHTLKPSLVNGYPVIAMCKNGKALSARIHRVVAAAFIGPCPEGKEVNHKNGVRTDNRAENLEYVTHRENIIHGQRFLPRKHTSLRGDRIKNSKLSADAVRAIRERLASGERQDLIAADYSVARQTVWKVAHGHQWKWVE